jgi:hypothetical protein
MVAARLAIPGLNAGVAYRNDVCCVELMRLLIRDFILFTAATLAGLSLTGSAIRLVRSPSRGLPYHDDFAGSDNSEWVAYDGNWNVQSGVMVNESNERGAKLITGSRYWTNYALDADISLSSTGDAGVIARVSAAEPGVDAYRGLYGGLRVRDHALVLGVADHGWNEIAAQPLPYPITSNVWYHIRMEVKGCHVTIFTYQRGSPSVVRLDESIAQCPEQGKIGLRSYDSGGQWKNIRVSLLQK